MTKANPKFTNFANFHYLTLRKSINYILQCYVLKSVAYYSKETECNMSYSQNHTHLREKKIGTTICNQGLKPGVFNIFNANNSLAKVEMEQGPHTTDIV